MQSSKASGLRPPSKIARPSSIAGSNSDLSASRSTSPSAILTENTDDFIVGNRVWVGGTKPGYIQYIGETKFAPGEWAGVVLDEPIGKNDGSVAGVKYFQCEPKKGVFSRLTKLTREPLLHLMSNTPQGSSDDVRGTASPRPLSTPRHSLTFSRSSTPTPDGALLVGDRVNVASASGTKSGVLRYLGTTEFATGEWAGIELDDAVGKNDGSVSGKRYFSCSMKYGLFAPIAKVTRARRLTSTKTPMPFPPVSSPKRSVTTPRRVGSQESVNTIGSTSSAAKSVSSKPRLGVTALTTAGKPSRVGPSISATHTAMQGALKEKEQHIEQLLRERELEMADVARSSAHLEESERTLASLRAEHQKFKEESEAMTSKFREVLEQKEKENNQLLLQLDEEKKKNEDLQFRFEEEAILKSELENANDNDDQRLQLLKDKFEAEKLELESQYNFQHEEALAKYSDEIEVLQKKLKESDEKVCNLVSKAESEGNYTSNVLDQLKSKSSQIEEYDKKFGHLSNEYEKFKKDYDQVVIKHASEIEELKSHLQKSKDIIQDLETKAIITGSKSNEVSEELQKKLNRINELSDLNNKLTDEAKKREQEIEEKEKTLASSFSDVEKLNQCIKHHEDTIKNLEDKIQLETKRSNQSSKDLADKENEIQKLNLINSKILEESKQHESEIEKSKSEMEIQHNVVINEFKTEIAKTELDVANLNKQLGNFQNEKIELEKKLRETEDKLSQQTAKYEAEIVEQLRCSGDNSAKLDRLSDQLKDRDKTIKELQQMCESYEREIKQLKVIIEENEITSSKQKAEMEAKFVGEREMWSLKQETEHKEVEKRVEELKCEAEKRFNELNKVMSQLEEEKRKSEEAKLQNEQMIKVADKSLEDVRGELTKLHKEKTELLQAKTETENENKKLRFECEQTVAERQNLQKEIMAKDEKFVSVTSEIERLKQHIAHHQLELQQKLEEAKLDDITVQNLKNHIEMQQKKLEEFQKALQESEANVAKLKEENSKVPILMENCKQMELKLQSTQNMLLDMEVKEKQLIKEFETEKETTSNLAETSRILLDQRSAESTKQQSEIENLKKELADKVAQLETALKDNAQIPKILSTSQQLQVDLEAAKMKVHQLEARELQLSKEFESEKETAHHLTETSRILLEQKSEESLKLQSEINSLKSELTNKEAKLEATLKDNDRLKANEVKNAVSNGNTLESKLLEEKEALESQVDFLNSVIVDMQKKVDDYQVQLQRLENGDKGSDINLNAIKMPVAPRMFCDICDMFDLHETEDCPRQASSHDSPPPTNYHGQRNQERPYCDTCEVFGHWTQECDDNETF